MGTRTDEKNRMTTMVSCMNKLQEDGFTENFIVDENGLKIIDEERFYLPEEVSIVNFYRFEGDSDPGSNSILYAIETRDGRKGLLSDAYGAYADENVTAFTAEVQEIMKKTDRNEEAE